MYGTAGLPQYVDIADPAAQHDDEILVTIRAVAVKHIDRSRAAGKHYSNAATPAPAGTATFTPTPADFTSTPTPGRIIGGDGVGLLPDGTRVFGIGASGTLAEKATFRKDTIVQIPDGLDDATAAALPNAVIGSAMGLKFKAQIRPGDTVLVNGATGFTGRLAIQIAKYYGAGKVIATGRNPDSLDELPALGVDRTISLAQTEQSFIQQLSDIHKTTPIDIVIDYLWGHSAEMILACLKGDASFTNPMRYVSIGSMSGDAVQLSSSCLRSANLLLTGSGLGAWSRSEVDTLFREILPEMFRLAEAGTLKIKSTTLKLQDIAEIWDTEVSDGRRLVVTI